MVTKADLYWGVPGASEGIEELIELFSDPEGREMLYGEGVDNLGLVGDLGRDAWNVGMDALGFLSLLNPLTPPSKYLTGVDPVEKFEEWKYESEPLMPLDSSDSEWKEILKEAINETYTQSKIDPRNKYKGLGSDLRFMGNVGGMAVSPAMAGRAGLPALVNKLPSTVKNLVAEILPKFSGRGTFFLKRKNPKKSKLNPFNYDYFAPSTARNVAATGALTASGLGNEFEG